MSKDILFIYLPMCVCMLGQFSGCLMHPTLPSHCVMVICVKELIMNVLFEHLGVQAVYMQDQAVFSMYSYHETTGIMVNIGDRMDIVPIVQGV